MKSGSSISALEIGQERTVGFIYALSGPLHSKILLHANKRYTKGVPFMSKMVYTMHVARNLCESLFLGIGDFLCSARTNFCEKDRFVFLVGN